ncbi:pyrroloquinoline quinone biosynthesis protein PqqF [Cronobacter malonaticus]|uniref:pyrroloquinoline quinone biosynthesis protein PqqF n=2 Tax=Cronobacter malonaticus TaxID=413503 RepID=UPI00188F12F9|nr:pyrroloquinoline quinone biosynthesis protein PqqF [Cronobacter malonaticus]MBF4835612.1 pyrroloquinoline quinone biosynthesis protein PqqF [Cronobacter malonaticus]MBF4845564.1 pyrroloquinoline quinone biosynthesis protein PqqF [Cronobacter malonaticus]MBF4849395.1 pyrroloquinoline quinone biosynthesis protein PqqF [Cronobacter malonaticus]MBF4862356.1 pyrroloquinoline quinone biosynthesis protein PqqF [Cronobacter malonaticus]MBF4885866.1 pyrroloquinoline quinone biosynthesis protein PqqF
MIQTRRLESGITITLIHQPQATQAAALWRVNAGSLHEPDDWPGLAHLLEHMLFRESEDYRDDERLMRWVPDQGGRLNASTRLSQTAFFFEVPAQALAPGLSRLTDMLAAPRFTPAALMQEAQVIDAEYRLLAQDAATRREAALLALMAGDARLTRLRIGNKAAFSEDPARLRAALTAFHEQHYHTGNLHLWLCGPQSLETLEALTCEAAARIRPGVTAPLSINAHTGASGALAQPGFAQLELSFLLPADVRPALRLLEQCLHSEAPGGLMAALRAQTLADDATLEADALDDDTLWLRFSFALASDAVNPAHVEALVRQWIAALAALPEDALSPLLRLAEEDVNALAPMDALRACAFGLPPVEGHALRPLLAALLAQRPTRLWISPEVHGATVTTQGLTLTTGDFPDTPDDAPPVTLFAPAPHFPPPLSVALPGDSAPLAWRPDAERITLTLEPAPGTRVSDRRGMELLARLRPLCDRARLNGGALRTGLVEGRWRITLCGDEALMMMLATEMMTYLWEPDDRYGAEAERLATRAQAQEDQAIAVRRLLAQLPRELLKATAAPGAQAWQATLESGGPLLRDALARRLSDFPFPLVTPTPPRPLPAPHRFTLPANGADSALLLFVPLAASQREAVTALQAPFFQHMRVEKNIGYVAQCQWHTCAGYEGLLALLQSPHLSPDALLHETTAFFERQGEAWRAVTQKVWVGSVAGEGGE